MASLSLNYACFETALSCNGKVAFSELRENGKRNEETFCNPCYFKIFFPSAASNVTHPVGSFLAG